MLRIALQTSCVAEISISVRVLMFESPAISWLTFCVESTSSSTLILCSPPRYYQELERVVQVLDQALR